MQRPATLEALAELVRTARAAGKQLYISGSGAMLPSTIPTDQAAEPISMLKLTQVITFEPAEQRIVVQAGIGLEALQRHLAWHNQWLPVDPAAPRGRVPGSRTLGGLVASDSLGPLRCGLGAWPRHIVSLQGISDEGLSCELPAESAVGSWGKRGIIATLTLRTAPRPAEERALVVFAQSSAQAQALSSAASDFHPPPAYVQITPRRTFQSNPLQLPASRYVVVLGWLGTAEACAAELAMARRAAEAQGCEAIEQTAAQAGRLRLWMASAPSGELAFRGHVERGYVPLVLGQIEALAAQHDCRAWLVSEATAGVMRGSLISAGSNAVMGRHLRALFAAAGGRLTWTLPDFKP